MAGIDDLRVRVDQITRELTKLLADRTRLVSEIGRIKESTGAPVVDPAREQQVREMVHRLADDTGLDSHLAGRFLNFLLNESVRVQPDTRQTHMSILDEARRLEQSGKKIIHMEVGQPDFAPPDIVGRALGQAYELGHVKYGRPGGMPQLRAAIAEYVSRNSNIDAGPDSILVSPGGRFAVYAAIETLLGPGDEMITIEPAWPAYGQCAAHADVKVRPVRTRLQDDWEPSPDQISEMVNGNTKMIVLNYPNNPTGKILPGHIQDAIVDIARENNLYILSDEIYSQYAFSDWKGLLAYDYDRVIVTQSFSKSHAMTGLRIGYAASNPELVSKMQKLYALSLTSVSEPVQYAALQALQSDVSANSDLIKDRLQALAGHARKAGLQFAPPDGAMYIFARPDIDGFDGSEFCHRALEAGLAVAPGSGFGDYDEFIRISACTDNNLMTEGMNILNDTLRGSG